MATRTKRAVNHAHAQKHVAISQKAVHLLTVASAACANRAMLVISVTNAMLATMVIRRLKMAFVIAANAIQQALNRTNVMQLLAIVDVVTVLVANDVINANRLDQLYKVVAVMCATIAQ